MPELTTRERIRAELAEQAQAIERLNGEVARREESEEKP